MKMADTGSPVGKYGNKWQLALAVGLPVAVGVGYWYLNNKNKKRKVKESDRKIVGKLRDTVIDTDKSAKRAGEPIAKTPLELATALKEEGNKHFKNSQFEEAISSYEKAIEICPEKETISLATFYQNKAAAYEQLQKYEDVKEACTKALSYNPVYTKALTRRAKACEHLKDLTQALEDVTAACILESFQSQTTLLSADRILKELGRQHAKEAMAKRVPVMPSEIFIKTYFSTFANDPINSFLSKTDGDNSKGYLKAVECFKNRNYELKKCILMITIKKKKYLFFFIIQLNRIDIINQTRE
ncbi:mitochondrial protein import receptor, putative [Pediculus humanus corporis]|uniref:Mitochondrial protein import receptor, putative n=1 Tax=Pediculus humanus subsp. corporis TaxID=121224 RepID=E0VNV2_PEDHC|nr:mitochondrial protein import receptor, putative [Pediculus humanus corporis]EEB15058.1 mitochondrial protein import receptor, putative [Pediculus humanus corporis]